MAEKHAFTLSANTQFVSTLLNGDCVHALFPGLVLFFNTGGAINLKQSKKRTRWVRYMHGHTTVPQPCHNTLIITYMLYRCIYTSLRHISAFASTLTREFHASSEYALGCLLSIDQAIKQIKTTKLLYHIKFHKNE